MELSIELADAILRTLRMLMLITGSLVLIDSIGILLMPTEHPPHKPKWAAISWCIVAGAAAVVACYLLVHSTGMVGENSPHDQRVAVLALYLGLTIGFTCRAVSRAHRPLFTVVAVVGLFAAGIVFALWDGAV